MDMVMNKFQLGELSDQRSQIRAFPMKETLHVIFTS